MSDQGYVAVIGLVGMCFAILTVVLVLTGADDFTTFLCLIGMLVCWWESRRMNWGDK